MLGLVIRIFSSMLIDEFAEKKLTGIFLKFYKGDTGFQKALGKTKSIYGLVFTPSSWLKLLKWLPKTKIVELEKTIKILERRTETRSYYQLDKDKYEGHIKELDDELSGKAGWIQLSSSWLNKGKFVVQFKGKMLGSLWLTTKKSNKIYIYPSFPYELWVGMKAQVGQNGSGAGTYFWKYWLRTWLPSQLRRKVKNDLENRKITDKEAADVFAESVSKSSRGYYQKKAKEYRSNPEFYKGDKSFFSYESYLSRNQKYNEYKKYYKYNSQKIIYKNKKVIDRHYETIKYDKKVRNGYGEFIYAKNTPKREAKKVYNKYSIKNKIKKGLK